MGIWDDILVGIGAKTEDDVKVEEILSLDCSRYKYTADTTDSRIVTNQTSNQVTTR